MTKPDRAEFARQNAFWLLPGFAALTAYGFLWGRIAALVAGLAGLIWVGAAVWKKK